ncbi:PBECR4 domain-containing protein [Bacillus bombysepticus]|uniref:PBECR4 domain-containing protein n=1 Tax=Bacillus bombysepticus TaxID=658666 RepID=UPI00301A8246
MLSVTDLLTIKVKPTRSEISLLTIQQFYKEHLCDRLFVYSTDDPQRPQIKLRFKEENLGHLLGLQHIFEETKHGTKYVGQSGYDLIKTGELTFDLMRKTKKSGYKENETRILFFPFVYQILHNPDSVIFDPESLTIRTKLKADLIFYNELNKRYLHLFLDHYKKRPEIYFAKSFFDRKNDKLIAGQTSVNVTKMDIILD